MTFTHTIAGYLVLEENAPMMPVWHQMIDKVKISLNSNTCHIDTTQFSSVESFTAELDLIDKNSDIIIITDEKWKPNNETGVNEFNNVLLNHKKLSNKNVIVLTHAYFYNKLDSNRLIASYPAYFIIGNYYNTTVPLLKLKNLPHGFSCLNRRAATHRILLGYYLHQQNLLDQIIFTQGIEGIEAWEDKFKSLPNFNNFKNLLPIKSESVFPLDFTVNHSAYTDAYCNIVTETETEKEIITEKSYKPFISKQIPIFLAAKGHLAYLKSLGFEVFEDLLPAGYDHLNVDEKISAIVEIVSRGKNFIEDFYFGHLAQIEHNYELYTSGRVEELLIQRINSKL